MNPVDKLTQQMEKELAKEYRIAKRELNDKLNKLLKDFKKQDEEWQRKLKKGKVSEKEYKNWRKDFLEGAKWTREMRNVISRDLYHINKTARQIIDRNAQDIYCEAVNYETYRIEKEAKFDTSFTLYSKNTIGEIVKENPRIFKHDIDRNKDMRYNMQRVKSALIQATLQGDSIPDLANRLVGITDKNYKDAVRTARTMTTSATNAGCQESYERASEKGIDMEKGWLATLDLRTRHSHRHMDLEFVPVTERFSNGMMHPGDWSADIENLGAEIYNCRCTMITKIAGIPFDMSHRSSKLGDMSYEEWKQNHIDLKDQSLETASRFVNGEMPYRAVMVDNALKAYDVEGIKVEITELSDAFGCCPANFDGGVVHVESCQINKNDPRDEAYQIKTAYHEAYHAASDGRSHDRNILGSTFWDCVEETMAEASAHYLTSKVSNKQLTPSYPAQLFFMLPRLKQLEEYKNCSTIADFGEIAYNQRKAGGDAMWNTLFDRATNHRILDAYYDQYLPYINSHKAELVTGINEQMPNMKASEIERIMNSAFDKNARGEKKDSNEKYIYKLVFVMAMNKEGVK